MNTKITGSLRQFRRVGMVSLPLDNRASLYPTSPFRTDLVGFPIDLVGCVHSKAVLVYLAIASLADEETGRFIATNQQIAGVAHISRANVDRGIASLRRVGWLKGAGPKRRLRCWSVLDVASWDSPIDEAE